MLAVLKICGVLVNPGGGPDGGSGVGAGQETQNNESTGKRQLAAGGSKPASNEPPGRKALLG